MTTITPQERYRQKNPLLYRSAALKYYYANKEKCAAKAKKWRDANRQYLLDKQREQKRIRKNEAIAYLGGVCMICGGVFHPAIYEFHHRDPKTKEKDPSKVLSFSWKRIISELDKCDLLCANCHRFLHHGAKY